MQSAAYFGRHAVDILARAGIDHLVFGSEINNLEELQEIASMSFNIDNFKENMARGYSYPASYGYMADSYGPNDILAISYLRLRSPNGYLLVLHYDEEAQMDIENTLKRNVRFYRLRSKTVTRSGAEMTVEIRLDHRVNIVTDMLDINGVYDATLVACQTEAGA